MYVSSVWGVKEKSLQMTVLSDHLDGIDGYVTLIESSQYSLAGIVLTGLQNCLEKVFVDQEGEGYMEEYDKEYLFCVDHYQQTQGFYDTAASGTGPDTPETDYARSARTIEQVGLKLIQIWSDPRE